LRTLTNLILLFTIVTMAAACGISATPQTESTSTPAAPAPTDTITAPPPSATPEPSPTPVPIPDRPHYDLDLTINYTYKVASVQEKIVYPNHTGESLATIELAVEPNLWGGGFSLQSVQVDGQELTRFNLEGQKLELLLDAPIAPDTVTELSLAFDLILPRMAAYKNENDVRPQIYGFTPQQMNLVDWFPFIVPYTPEDQWVLYNPWFYGEHLMYDAADFDVTIRFSDGSNPVIAASGEEIASDNGRRFRLEKARTFALSMSNEYLVSSTQVGDVTVNSYYFPFFKIPGPAVLDATAKALQTYSELFGPYPHKTLSAVQGDFNDGMEFDGLYFLSRDFYNLYDGTPKNYLTAIAVHETAHQWWFALIGNNQALDPWLDESFATYSERLYYEHNAPDALKWWWGTRVNFYEPQGKLDTRIYDGNGYRPYINAVYLRGALFFEALRQRIGDEAFFAFLRDYTTELSFKRSTPDDFFRILHAHTGDVDIYDILGEYFTNPK
jgi:hypothetical protein